MSEIASTLDVGAVVRLLAGKKVAVLTGAGVSTGSGIPDYRSPGRPQRTPIQHKQFVESDAWRRRYWARSLAGWPLLSAAQPNVVHDAIARLELAGVMSGLVTQNVDRLHQRAGSRVVVELHGALADVVCLGCGAHELRTALQDRLAGMNPAKPKATQPSTPAGSDRPLVRAEPGDVESRPDGDAEVDAAALERFVVPACLACGGVLMPDVVFFGGTVPRERVERAMSLVSGADVLLVLGTSLAVFSGWRFVRRAHERAMPIVIVNRGPTRGDPQASAKLDTDLERAVPALVDGLVVASRP